MRTYERLMQYAQVFTTSDPEAEGVPSTERQFDLARLLERELKELGASDVLVDEHCYVYAKIPATPGYEDRPAIGFLAHLDTAPDFSGEHVHPRAVPDYDGGEIPLGDSGRVLRPADFPHLAELKGDTLIVTDGTTLLGADDKAGIAEIMTAAERLLGPEGFPHGPVCIGFCPDEEIGHGAALLDLDRFGAELAYTLDGGAAGELEYENFNAAAAEVEFTGLSVHPGAAKGLMVNAALAAFQFNALLPAGDVPRETKGYEGFFHLMKMEGDVEHACLSYIIRDHDAGSFEARKNCLRHAADLLNSRYGPGTVRLELREQYRNMLEQIRPHFEVVELAMAAAKAAGMEPKTVPIRGGTDGAQLSWRGLPCPNLPTGSGGHHGPYEYASAREMDQCVELILHILREAAKPPKG